MTENTLDIFFDQVWPRIKDMPSAKKMTVLYQFAKEQGIDSKILLDMTTYQNEKRLLEEKKEEEVKQQEKLTAQKEKLTATEIVSVTSLIEGLYGKKIAQQTFSSLWTKNYPSQRLPKQVKVITWELEAKTNDDILADKVSTVYEKYGTVTPTLVRQALSRKQREIFSLEMVKEYIDAFMELKEAGSADAVLAKYPKDERFLKKDSEPIEMDEKHLVSSEWPIHPSEWPDEYE